LDNQVPVGIDAVAEMSPLSALARYATCARNGVVRKIKNDAPMVAAHKATENIE
jgi:hypothetical protein